MLKETADFIKQNKDLINDNDWDTIYNKLKSYNKNNNFLNISMMIDFTKVLLDSGINLGIDYNQLNSDLSILKNLNSEHFSSPSTVKEDDQMCLYDETMAKSLTNVLRSCRVLDENDSIPGGPMDYNTLSIYIIGVHDKEVIKDVFEHSYGNYWFDIAIQLTSKNNKFLCDWVTKKTVSFNVDTMYRWDGEEDCTLEEDDMFYNNIDNVLQEWVKELLL